MTRPLDVYVVRHTHWDREWYHPAGRFRQRLVALVDELLDTPPASFLLDGQAVVLDDYLAVRPGRRDALGTALANGALEAGPWYVLADELIPSGEALVRNLLAGRRTLSALGATAPPVLYAPDAFGHAAALPILASGFGCALTVVWRGYGGARWPDGDAAWWEGADGSRTLLWHLPPDGYELGSSLPTDDDLAAERWSRMRAQLASRERLGLTLLPNGADHHAPQREWPRALDALRRAATPDRVIESSLATFASEARRRADNATLPVVRGELRDSYGYTWALQGTFASRTAQKRRNAHAQRLLERDVEPWLALRHLRDGARAREQALLNAAWTTLLLCHPHDTLCGCSTDDVARAADARWDDVCAQACGLRHDAIAALLHHDADESREHREAWWPALVVRNRAARARGGVAKVELATFVCDVAVGPGSAGRWTPVRPLGTTPAVYDGEQRLTVQVLDRTLRHDRGESPRHYPDDDVVEAARALVWVPPLDGLSLRVFAIGSGGSMPAGPPSVRVDGTSLSNEHLTVDVDTKGNVRLRSATLAIDSLVAFEDIGDAGDLYTHSAVGKPIATVRSHRVRVVHRGPLRGEIEIDYRLRVPLALHAAPTDDPFSRPSRRAHRNVDLPITVRISLDAGAPFMRLYVRGDNRARDHRLRIVFRTGLVSGRVVADAAFGAVEREPVMSSPLDALSERPTNAAPLHRWVAHTDDAHTFTLFSDGLGEYDALDGGRIAVTLVRAVGELSRPDLPERPGHAGWPVPTPEAQQLGPFEAHFAIAIALGIPDVAAIEQLADDALLPLTGDTLRSALTIPHPAGGITLHGEGLVFSAAKPSEDGSGIVLRCMNTTTVPARGAWSFAYPIAAASLVRLDETRVAELTVHAQHRVDIEVAPRAVHTIMVST